MSFKNIKRWTAKRKFELVVELMKGRSLEELSRESGQPAHLLSSWRDQFLESGAELFRELESPKENTQDQQLYRAYVLYIVSYL